MVQSATARDGHTALHVAAKLRDSNAAAEMTEAILGSDRFPTDAANALDGLQKRCSVFLRYANPRLLPEMRAVIWAKILLCNFEHQRTFFKNLQ